MLLEMGSAPMSYEGGCLCGANRYEILRKHLNAMHCYCETFVEELVPWHAIADDLPQHEGWPSGFGPAET